MIMFVSGQLEKERLERVQRRFQPYLYGFISSSKKESKTNTAKCIESNSQEYGCSNNSVNFYF